MSIVKRIEKVAIVFLIKIIYKTFSFGAICNLLLFSSRLNRLIIDVFEGKIGKNTTLNPPLFVYTINNSFSNLIIGNKCHIGKNVFFDLVEQIIIEDRTVISMRVTILTHIGVAESPLKKIGYPTQKSSVIIKSGAYIGAGCMILPGVIIGENAVVGAGAVVDKDIPPYCVAVGVPAKVIKRLIPAKM